MINKIYGLITALFLSLTGVLSVVNAGQTATQENRDTLTIISYYPLQQGIYGQIESKIMVIGDHNNDGKVNFGDYPKSPKPNPVEGQLYVSRSVVLRPKGDGSINNPAVQSLSSPQIGEMVYNFTDQSAYIYNGNTWIKQSNINNGINGPMCYVEYGSSCTNKFTPRGNAGDWGWCEYSHSNGAQYSFFLPPRGKCPTSPWPGFYFNKEGTAIVCCL
jgi:hypothetical protein